MSNRILAIALLLLVFHPLQPAVAGSSGTKVELTVTRRSDLNVKVVFVGIPSELVNATYLKWNVPAYKCQQYLNPGVTTGVQYRFDYEFIFPPKGFEDSFAQYLTSIGKVEVAKNPFFGVNLTNTLYSASLAENWLKYHESDYGGSPKPGYTLILANLTRAVPSVTPNQYEKYLNQSVDGFTPHYYNMTYVDSDLYITIRRRWMTSWGGPNRLYFIDLSAGPSNITRQLPLQWAIRANNIDLKTLYGSMWLTQYLSDYVYGAVEDLFAPDFVYPIAAARKYDVDVLVVDNRTDGAVPSLDRTLNVLRIKSELERLLPFAEVNVKARFMNVTASSNLTNLIVSSTSPSKYAKISIVDARPVYNWLSEEGQGHIKDFFNNTRKDSEYYVPVMAFIFTGEYQFGFTFKEDLSEPFGPESIWGVALGDLVLVSHSSHDLVRGNFTDPKQTQTGFGLTNTVIHELGHMLGLVHPFRADPTQDFVASVMSYYPYEYSYSQFDRDALLRGYVDGLIMGTEAELEATGPNILNSGLFSSIQQKLEVAERHYANMSYEEALSASREARRAAAFCRYVGNIISTTGYVALNVFAAIAGTTLVALVFHILARTRRQTREPTRQPFEANSSLEFDLKVI